MASIITRKWECPNCHTHHDRDLNAAINLAVLAQRNSEANYAVSSTVFACGGEGSGSVRKSKTKPAPMKQEVNTKLNYG